MLILKVSSVGSTSAASRGHLSFLGRDTKGYGCVWRCGGRPGRGSASSTSRRRSALFFSEMLSVVLPDHLRPRGPRSSGRRPARLRRRRAFRRAGRTGPRPRLLMDELKLLVDAVEERHEGGVMEGGTICSCRQRRPKTIDGRPIVITASGFWSAQSWTDPVGVRLVWRIGEAAAHRERQVPARAWVVGERQPYGRCRRRVTRTMLGRRRRPRHWRTDWQPFYVDCRTSSPHPDRVEATEARGQERRSRCARAAPESLLSRHRRRGETRSSATGEEAAGESDVDDLSVSSREESSSIRRPADVSRAPGSGYRTDGIHMVGGQCLRGTRSRISRKDPCHLAAARTETL